MAFTTKLDLSGNRQVKNSPNVESVPVTSSVPILETTKIVIKTEVVVAEDNSIELNYGGNKVSAVGGGIAVLSAISDTQSAEFKTNINGDWTTNNNLLPNGLVVPFYTPTSSVDVFGHIGLITRDDFFVYIKTQDCWKRTKLERF